MLRPWIISALLGTAAIVVAAEPPAGGLDPNDPLFQALQEVKGEIDALKLEAGGGMSPPKRAPAGMTAPSMSPGGMTGPGMRRPAASTRTTPPTAAAVGQGRELPPPARSIAAPPLLGPAVRTTSKIWSFQRLKAPLVPTVKNTNWPRDDVDRFLLAKLEAADVAPNPEADAAANDQQWLTHRHHLDIPKVIGTPRRL